MRARPSYPRELAMSHSLLRWCVAAVVTQLLTPSAAPATPRRCSLIYYPNTQPELYFLGRGTRDTAIAGAGDVREGGGIFQRPGAPIADRITRPVYGQVVRVSRVGGSLGPRLERAMRNARREVLLVPWGYGSDCGVGLWGGSARWSQVDAVGLFTARLRPESLWVDRRPTLDVFAAWYEPYPHGEFLRSRRSRDERPDTAGAGGTRWLTAEELFELYRALPALKPVRRDAPAEVRPLEAWHRAHPELATRFPASLILNDRYHAADFWPAVQRVRAISSPFAGTYRLDVSLAGGEPRALYVRLARKAHLNAHGLTKSVPLPHKPGRHHTEAVGYSVDAHGARTLDSLDSSADGTPPDPCGITFVSVALDSVRHPDGGTTWRGEFEPSFLARCFASDPVSVDVSDRLLAMAMKELEAEKRGRFKQRDFPATFRLTPSGELLVEQVTSDAGRELIRIRGRRIDTEALDRSRERARSP